MNIFNLLCGNAYFPAYGRHCGHVHDHVNFHVDGDRANLNDDILLQLIYQLSHDYSFNCVYESNFYDYNFHCVYGRLIDLRNFI